MTNLIFQFVTIVIIAIVTVGATILWRTCIYTRGGIFRFIGRVLDKWVDKGCLPKAKFKHKILRFLAYPLGRCIYCSSIHIGYNLFFILNIKLQLNLPYWWLIILLPILHLFIIVFSKSMLQNNSDMDKGDWAYMEPNDIFDMKCREKEISSPLTKKEENILEQRKSGPRT